MKNREMVIRELENGLVVRTTDYETGECRERICLNSSVVKDWAEAFFPQFALGAPKWNEAKWEPIK